MARQKYNIDRYDSEARRPKSYVEFIQFEAERRNRAYPQGEMNEHCTRGLNRGRCRACLVQTLARWGVDVKAYYQEVATARRAARKVWLEAT